MIIQQGENRNFQAVSAFEPVEGQYTPIMVMNASYQAANKQLNFSESIQNYDLYSQHTEMVEEDLKSFRAYVLSAIGG